jgi:hypothetical protein
MIQFLALYDNLDAKIKKIKATAAIPGPKGDKGDKGDKGADGAKGDKGPAGKDGVDGKDGIDGTNGEDGVSIVDVKVDFDNSVVVTLSNGVEIDAGQINVTKEGDTYYTVSMGGGSGGGAFGEKGFAAPYTASEALSVNTLCCLGVNGKMAPASATALSTVSSLLALPQSTLGADDTGRFLLQGFANIGGFVAGDILYVSEDDGLITNFRPENTGFFVRVVGYAISNEQIYFDPDKTWLELT